jgi:hypothetical protein
MTLKCLIWSFEYNKDECHGLRNEITVFLALIPETKIYGILREKIAIILSSCG